jgi:UDP-glucose 4-epimerase
MRKVTGRDLSVTYTRSRTYDVPEIYLDITKAAKELEWEPRTSLEKGIKYTWDFVSNLP